MTEHKPALDGNGACRWDKLLDNELDAMLADYFESGDAARDMAMLDIKPDEVGCITCEKSVPRSQAKCIDVAYDEDNQEVPVYECSACLPRYMQPDGLYDKAACPDLEVSPQATTMMHLERCAVCEQLKQSVVDGVCDECWIEVQQHCDLFVEE